MSRGSAIGPASVSTIAPASSRSVAITTSSSGCSRSVADMRLALPRVLDGGDVAPRAVGDPRAVAPAQPGDVYQIGAGAHRAGACRDEVPDGRERDAAGRYQLDLRQRRA